MPMSLLDGHFIPPKREKKQTRNDSDREQWVNNHEPLYAWWKAERGSMRDFIRTNRAEIDRIIDGVLNKPPAGKWEDTRLY